MIIIEQCVLCRVSMPAGVHESPWRIAFILRRVQAGRGYMLFARVLPLHVERERPDGRRRGYRLGDHHETF